MDEKIHTVLLLIYHLSLLLYYYYIILLIITYYYYVSNIRLKLIHVSKRGSAASLRWRHNGCDSVSNHQPHHCLLNRLFRRRSKKTPKPRVTGLCAGNSPVTGEFSAQMTSNAENVSIWWCHHVHWELLLGRIYDWSSATETAMKNVGKVITRTHKNCSRWRH